MTSTQHVVGSTRQGRDRASERPLERRSRLVWSGLIGLIDPDNAKDLLAVTAERSDAEIEQPFHRRERTVRVERRQDKVSGVRSPERDFGSLQIADLTDKNDVRVLAQNRRSALANVRPALTSTGPG